MNHTARLIAIENADAPLSVMHYTTTGRGDLLPNGAEWIVAPNSEDPLGWWTRPVTDALVFEQIARQFSGNGRPMPARYVVLPENAELPADREYRNAWALDGDKVVIDLATAKDLHRAKLREARAPRLVELDVAFVRALEAGENTAAIVAEKNRLREVTKHPAIDAAQTIDQLKAATLGLL